MGRRLDLQKILAEILGTDNVYFQPGANITLKYPAIIYKRDMANTEFADNKPYQHTKRYMVTIIDRNPDSEIPDKIATLPMCLFVRHYAAENLNHDVYSLYF